VLLNLIYVVVDRSFMATYLPHY